MKMFFVCCLLASTSACAGEAYTYSPDRETSPYVSIPGGATLELLQDQQVPAERARFYIQYGQVKPFKEIDLYYPNCSLLVNDVLDTPQTIKKDRFIVYRTQRTVDLAALRSPLVYSRMRGVDDSGPSYETWTTTLYLRSEQQPQVRLLRCEHWEDPTDGQHLSIKQIRDTLGDVMKLHIPTSQPTI